MRLLDGPAVRDLEGDRGSEPPQTLDDHTTRYGRLRRAAYADPELLSILDRLEISGRGGGHFPVNRKLRSVLAAGGGGFVIGNGHESEPASAKDAVLLSVKPHLVIDGLITAAVATGSPAAVIWLDSSHHHTIDRLAGALAERGQDLGGVQVQLVTAPRSYLAGESSAIISALGGGSALPGYQEVSAAVRGLAGRPTLVHNVETLAHLGRAWQGGGRQLPTQLTTVLTGSGRIVIEVECGQMTVAELFTEADRISGGESTSPHESGAGAVLVGGYGGQWVPFDRLRDLTVDQTSFSHARLSLGAAVFARLGAGQCGLRETARILRYLAGESARQCGPCRFGLPELSASFSKLAAGTLSGRGARQLADLFPLITGRGACAHPDASVRLVRSALEVFSADADSHLRRGRCQYPSHAGVFPIPVQGRHGDDKS